MSETNILTAQKADQLKGLVRALARLGAQDYFLQSQNTNCDSTLSIPKTANDNERD